MLAISITRDNAIETWVMVEEIVETSLKGSAFTQVHSVADDMDLGIFAQLIEGCVAFRIAAVIHDNNCGKPDASK